MNRVKQTEYRASLAAAYSVELETAPSFTAAINDIRRKHVDAVNDRESGKLGARSQAYANARELFWCQMMLESQQAASLLELRHRVALLHARMIEQLIKAKS